MKNNNRIQNSKSNVKYNILQLIVTTILTFVTRTIFIYFLGKEALGLDGLLTNILSMLSLTELGFGAAISFSLYKPLATNDIRTINQIMTYYKKIYSYIGIFVFIIGLLIMPFLPLLANGYTNSNIYIIYFLYLLNTSSSYFITYKETLIIADQKEYKLFWIRFIRIIILYSLQILFLVITKQFVSYLLIMVIVNFIQNIEINRYIGKNYSYIDFNCQEEIGKDLKHDIFSNVKYLFIGKIGNYLLNGTDNIIISIINIGLTGIYSNYLAVIGIMQTLMNSIYNSITSSFGNVIAIEKENVQEKVFDISNFVCFIISSFITIELALLFNPFINLWIGSNYLLDYWIVFIISLNFYFYSQTVALDTVVMASGLYKINRKVPIIQAIINLIFSIILGKYLGIGGVVLGTLISYLSVGIIAKPILIYKYLFNKTANKYLEKQLINFVILALTYFIIKYVISFIEINSFLTLILVGIIIMILYILIICILNLKNENFNYLINVAKNSK